MDGHGPDHGRTADGSPPTRRELRARAAGTRVDGPDPWASATGAPDERVPETGAGPPAPPPTDDPEPATDSWGLAVGWALRHEMPATLPPETDLDADDVRWDPVLPQRPAGPAEDTSEAADTGPGLRELWREDGGLADVAVKGPGVADADAGSEHGVDPAELGVDPAEHGVDPADPGGAVGRADADAQPRRVSAFGTSVPTVSRAPLWQPPGTVASLPVASPPPPPPADPSPDDGDALPREADADRVGGEASSDEIDPIPGSADAGPVEPPPSLPTLDDLLAARPDAPRGPAEQGWRGTVRRLTGGVVAPGPGTAERRDREAVASVQRSLDGPRTVVVINPKGGAHKTTATLLIAATFGRHRGGYTLAWDNNETRGTLGWRSRHAHHDRTAVDLLEDLERFTDPGSSRVGDLDGYVRSQGSAQFDVLASDEDAASAASIDAFAFRALHRTLTRFYRLLVIDTGNNMRASNWQAAVEAADQVVIVSTMRQDTAQSAAWALDALRATGHEDVVRKAVTVLSLPAPRRDDALAVRLHDHFGRLTRAVFEVPYEPTLVSGGPIDYDALSGATRRAWLRVTAAVSDGL